MTTWLITGANRGIGLELARQLTQRNITVIGTARQVADAAELQSLGGRVVALDVADDASVAALGTALADTPIDVLVNNAGQGGQGTGIDNLDFDEVARLFRINSLGPMRVVQALLPSLRRGTDKLIVHMSSNLGSIGNNDTGGRYAYRTSKAALNMLNRSLAHELGQEGFRCIVVHPGWVSTDMGGPNAPITPAHSVAGLLAVTDKLTAADNGKLLNFEGAELPW